MRGCMKKIRQKREGLFWSHRKEKATAASSPN